MENRGLKSSLWARKHNDRSHGHSLRSSDWTCSPCGFDNFSFRKECFRCSSPNTNSDGKPPQTAESTNMKLPLQQSTNSSALSSSGPATTAHKPNPAKDPLQNLSVHEKSGLATSRWAPRNISGGSRAAGAEEVWTRVAPIATFIGNSQARTTTSSRSESPGLGLPYEVQHFILSMMQRILEEGIYAFASRWVPDDLNVRGWTCSEAVELSTWRKTLPDIIPPGSLVPVPRYSLREALRDAVEIRNAAAHRHLCDNIEICRMASKAQDLMRMFSDITRQDKFSRLRKELIDWDGESKSNMEIAQDKLQQAIQEINEQPLDDMDWTPNSVSLRELTPVTPEVYPVDQVFEPDFDAMDLD